MTRADSLTSPAKVPAWLRRHNVDREMGTNTGDLQQRVFGRKSERSKGACERQGSTVLKPAPRGQRPGATGHGRTILAHLPQRVETVEIDTPQCPQ